MIYIDELKDFKLYKRQFFLPRNQQNKKLGGLCMLLTPNIESSIRILNDPIISTGSKYYQSYYTEKDISLYVNENHLLDSYPEEENYVHEQSGEGEYSYVHEGIYKHLKRNIIYNGYSSDVNRVRALINTNSLEECNEDLNAPIHYPLSITVLPSVSGQQESITSNAITLRSPDQFNNDKEFYLYTREIIYEYLIKCINPKVHEGLCEVITMVLAGTYAEYEYTLKTDSEYKYYYALCKYIDNLVNRDPHGWIKLNKIIKKNAVNSVNKGGLKYVMKDLKEMAVIDETGKMDPVKLLKRNITYKSRKGSVHIKNKIENIIAATTDNTVKGPSFTKGSDDPNITNINPPTIGDIQSQIQSAAAGQGSGMRQSNPDGDGESTDMPKAEASEVLEENYTWFDRTGEDMSIVQMENTITFFNEAESKKDPILYKILYKERLKNNRAIAPIYSRVKQECPNIQYAFYSYKRYKNKNLIVDFSYYNDKYFKNAMYKRKKGLDIYLNLLDRMINDKRISEAGYSGKKCLIIPVSDWDLNPKTKMWLYTKDINPVSLIYNLMMTNETKLKKVFGNIDIIFFAPNGYFKINFAKADLNKNRARFIPLIRKLRSGEPIEDLEAIDNKDTKAVIMDKILDDIEDGKNVKISHLTGNKGTTKRKIQSKFTIAIASSDDSTELDKTIKDETPSEGKQEKLKQNIIDKVEDAAEHSSSTDAALENLEDDKEFKEMLAQLTSDSDGTVKIDAVRKNRLDRLDKQLLEKKVNNTTVKDLIDTSNNFGNESQKPMAVPIDSINEEWKHLKYPGANKSYDLNADIVNAIYHFEKRTYPIGIRDLTVEDTSNSEDYINTYTVQMESHTGKRFSIKLDIPIVIDDQYMMLRGNKKVISVQSYLAPIVKTDKDTAQIISNYNKIFVRRFGGNTVGKSNSNTDRTIKTLRKLDEEGYDGIKVTWGTCDSSLTGKGYTIPIEMEDFSSVIKEIKTKYYTWIFDLDYMIEQYGDYINPKKNLPVGVWTTAKNKKDSIIYLGDTENLSSKILTELYMDKKFKEVFDATNLATRYVYSKASIMSSNIPLIVIAAYSEGLVSVLDKSKFKYEFVEKLPVGFRHGPQSIYNDFIKFSDGYLIYENSPQASLLLNGLKECPTEMYSVMDVNNKTTYLEFLDNFGGRLKADGLDNFYDCLLDPITVSVLKHYDMPTDYIEVLLYANNLLADNDYFTHGNQACRRFRKNEIIAGYAYKALATAYGVYSTNLKHGREMPFTVKRSAVIDAILLDPTAGDLSVINALNEKESFDLVTTKGLSGMNSDRSYSVDKRAYDESMSNVLSMSTNFAATVGIGRQATINADIDTARGYVNPNSKDFNSINSLCMAEALTPFGTTRDDPFRSAMTYVQTTRHQLRTKKSDPLLITNGADEALPYLISDNFVHKAKDSGEVVELVENDYMIIKYKSRGSEYINLKDSIQKNSASGFYINVKLDTDLKVGSKVKEGDIVAYDRHSFNSKQGLSDNPAYLIGTLCKVAMLDTDEGFEDSAIVSEDLSEAMTSVIYEKKEINLDKNASIYNLVKEGTPVEEGDTIVTIQAAFEDSDANVLLKNLSGTEEEISELGRVNIKSPVTGWIQEIEIARTVDLDELSPSLKSACQKFENNVKKHRAAAAKQGVEDTYKIGVTGKLPATGRLKGTPEGVLITIYIAYEDKFSIGDKLVYWSANKGVAKDIFPKGEEPYSLDRPDEKIHTLVAIASVNGRMVASIQNNGVINRLLVEASRKAKDILGIDYSLSILK